MPGNPTRSSRKALAAYLLVLLQVNLLGVAMLHRHSEAVVPGHGLWVLGSETHPSPTSESGVPCAVCQIVHSSAVQPAPAAQIRPPATMVPLVRRLVPSDYCSVLLTINYGRAPPLS